MSNMKQILSRSNEDSQGRGIVCPTPNCQGVSGILQIRRTKGQNRRRRVCARCGMKFVTLESIEGGFSQADIDKALTQLAEWNGTHSNSF